MDEKVMEERLQRYRKILLNREQRKEAIDLLLMGVPVSVYETNWGQEAIKLLREIRDNEPAQV